MTLVEEDPVNHPLDCLVERRVVEYHVWRLAAEFQGQPLAGAGQPPLDNLADLGGAGEGDLVDPRVGDQLGTRPAVAGDDVEDTRGQTRLGREPREGQRTERGGLRRLQHHSVTGREGGRHLPGEHQYREVPGDHLARHPQRPRVQAGEGVLQLVGPSGVVEEVGRGQGEVDVARLLDRFAPVEGLEHGELPRPLLQHPGQPEQVFGALPAVHPSPDPGVGVPRRRHRPVHVLPTGLGNPAEGVLGGRVDGREVAVGGGRGRFPRLSTGRSCRQWRTTPVDSRDSA